MKPDTLFHPDVEPAGVYRIDDAPHRNQDITPHALAVAGVMIAKGTVGTEGVATGALLYSSSLAPIVAAPQFPTLEVRAMQHLSALAAVNASYSTKAPQGNIANGNSLVPMALDWLTTTNGALFVTTGPNNSARIADLLPMDAFNDISVQRVELDAPGGVFRRIPQRLLENTSSDGRRLTDLVAPGVDIQGPLLPDKYQPVSGNSYAAPHATGTIALLQEYVRKPTNNLPQTAQQHAVMKAAVMNSAAGKRGHSTLS